MVRIGKKRRNMDDGKGGIISKKKEESVYIIFGCTMYVINQETPHADSNEPRVGIMSS